MRSVINKLALVASTLAGLASAQEFRVVGEIYSGTPGDTATYRTWYGDGHLYVGAHVPEDVEHASNFTITDFLANQPLALVGPSPPLPENSYLAINNAKGATDPVLVTSDLKGLGPDHILEWVRYGTLLIPRWISPPTKSNFYLAKTSEPETFIVTWRAEGAPVDNSEYQSINITAIL